MLWYPPPVIQAYISKCSVVKQSFSFEAFSPTLCFILFKSAPLSNSDALTSITVLLFFLLLGFTHHVCHFVQPAEFVEADRQPLQVVQ